MLQQATRGQRLFTNFYDKIDRSEKLTIFPTSHQFFLFPVVSFAPVHLLISFFSYLFDVVSVSLSLGYNLHLQTSYSKQKRRGHYSNMNELDCVSGQRNV